MPDEKHLDKIISYLNDDERINLYQKFNNLSYSSNKTNYDETINEDKNKLKKDNEEYIKKCFEELGFFEKLFVMINSFISGKTRLNVMMNVQLNKIKKEIKESGTNLINFENNTISYNFIKEIIDLYCKIIKLRPIIDNYYSDNVYYFSFISYIIEKIHKNSIVNYYDDIYPETLQDDMKYVDINAFNQEKDKRLKKYFKHMDTINFDNLFFQFNDFDILTKLVNFDYEAFFRFFSITNVDSDLSIINSGKYFEIEELLRKFIRIIFSINFIIDDMVFLNDLPKYTNEFPSVSKNISSPLTDQDIGKIKDVLEKIIELKSTIPFIKIVQYFSEDLFYKPVPIRIKIDYLSIYKEYKRTITGIIWEKYYVDLRHKFLQHLISTLFENHKFTFNSLTFFNVNFKDMIDNYSQIKIKYVYQLNLLYAFIKVIYKEKIEMIFNRIIIDGTFRNETEKGNLSTAYYSLLHSLEKIELFNKKFDNTRELGKRIDMVIKKISSDSNFKSILTNIVNSINTESNMIINEINECFLYLEKFLVATIDIKKINQQPITNFDKIRFPGFVNSFYAVDKVYETYLRFKNVYKMVDELYIN